MANASIDSNATGTYFAEETSPKVLPGSPTWHPVEVNSYTDLGSKIASVARETINASRQRGKGSMTDLDASAGYNIDLTQRALQRIMQGFFYADMREKPTTAPVATATTIPITSVSSTQYVAASGLAIFAVGQLVMGTNFANAANNGIHLVTAASATAVTAAGLVAEATPPATARLEVVGFQFGSADAALTVSGSTVTLTTIIDDLTTHGFVVGEWIFLGGDQTVAQFSGTGYARIATIAAHAITFDRTTWTAVADAGTGKLIQIFAGKVLKNEQPSLIKPRTYAFQRTLGSDGVGVQAQLVTGCGANEVTFNFNGQTKATVDMSFVGLGGLNRTGTQGVATGTYNTPLGEEFYNTSTDIYSLKVNILDPATSTPTALFAYATDAKLTIGNGVTANKALGNVGGFSLNSGDFAVSGSLTVYFSTVAALDAIRNNADVAWNMILAKKNQGIVFDIPLLELSNGIPNVSKDKPVTIPLDQAAAMNKNGYTLLTVWFNYLPTIAMPAS